MKNTSFIGLLFGCFLLISTSIFADGKETRSLNNFSKLEVSSGIQVTLVKSSDNSAIIETKNVEPSEILTKVENGKLKIKFKNSNSRGKNRKASVTLNYKSLESLSASSDSSVKSEESIQADQLNIDVSSGASCHVKIDCEQLDIDVSSGASAHLDGTCNMQVVDISSGASYKASNLSSASAKVNASSGASARIWVKESIKASASSGGSVRYKGNPSTTDINAGFSGSVKKV